MKPFVIVLIIIYFTNVNGFAQNRISTWDTEKITSIQVEFKTISNEKKLEIFNTKQEIDKIISFLKAVEFKEFGDSNIDIQKNKNNWKYKIIFEGQRDQIYLFDNFAFIGKTSFLIENKVIDDFKKLIEEF
ncbi:hypothetical protein ACFLQ5_00545 [Bacteroidota bacterium]